MSLPDVPVSPSTQLYMLGRGVLYFDRFDSCGDVTGERHLGNVPEFKINVTMETVAHEQSQSGLKTKDLEVPLRANATAEFTIEEFSLFNMMIALYGTEGEISQAAGSVAAPGEACTTNLGTWTKLTYRNVSNVAIVGGGYTEGTDYTVDEVTGRIYWDEDSTLLTDGGTLYVTYDYAVTEYVTIQAFGANKVEGFLRFIGDPQNGPIWEVEGWRVQLSTDGDINFIADEFGQINIMGSFQGEYNDHPNEPFFRLILRGMAEGTCDTTSTTTES